MESIPTQLTESQPLGDAPEFLPVHDIDGMEPYATFSQRIPRAIFLEREDDDPVRIIRDHRDAPFIAWKMAQIVVSVLQDLPTTLESKTARDWIINHFYLREESTQDPDHIVLPTNGSVLCYRHEPVAEFAPVTRLDAIGKANYVAHNDAGHDYAKKEAGFVIVGSIIHNPQTYSILDFSRHCPTCIKNANENYHPSIRKSTVTVPARTSRLTQQLRMLAVGRDAYENDDADHYKGKAAYQELSFIPLSVQSSLAFIASDVASETAISDTGNDSNYFDMAPPQILDEDDDVSASQTMLEIENSVYERRDDDPPSDE
ncbi:uncharacterized protein BT62DRAFT_1075243 [Guyanagaster necrorhizus]|uniref:Uncharacterized protein n=1 Tax=Guyanagaster necrorhizus TaxID=856835 RepID=A0A9P7VTJ5_9AGAR|nr:uncharacterized protein BT62DRAFT_1075243 [Guyanagaster necrorhizus MCA 3950]KAG7447148.1 hypothetical protein BT62DRAFT_1075243 [Guyanagaster necrorhizus MCA 3950]